MSPLGSISCRNGISTIQNSRFQSPKHKLYNVLVWCCRVLAASHSPKEFELLLSHTDSQMSSSPNGIRERLALDAIELLFGKTARQLSESLVEYAPCPLHAAAEFAGIPISDAKTVALAMYVHGIISIVQDSKRQFVSLNTLPALILSAPAILLDHVEAAYHNEAKYVTKALMYVLKNGIVEEAVMEAKVARLREKTDDERELGDDTLKILQRLLEDGLLVRRIIDFSSFTTVDVRNVERRAMNLCLTTKKKTKSASTDESIDRSALEPRVGIEPINDVQSFTINWSGVANFLRGRFVCQLAASVLGQEFVPLVEKILACTKACDYSVYKRLAQRSDEGLMGSLMPNPRLDVMTLFAQGARGSGREDMFCALDKINASQMRLLVSGDGSFWTVSVPEAIKSLQMQYIEMYCEQTLSPYHRRCFNHMRTLKVAETHQIEAGALLSEKDARSSLYNLARLGFIQVQMIPRTSVDRMINPRSIFVWRYDEAAAIEAYTTIIGEHARKLLAKVASLNEEYEANDTPENVEAGNMSAARINEKKEKFLCGFNVLYVDALRVFILFSEM